MNNKPKAFISGALSRVHGKVRLEIFYERIGKICEKYGIDPFIPHLSAGTHEHPDLTPEQMYNINMEQINKSDLVLAYVGQPSTGTGMEIQNATHCTKDIITLSEDDRITSKLLRGCPSVIECIEFDDFTDALEKLEKALEKWLKSKDITPPE